VPVWCESAGAAADLVRYSAECFGRLADHAERAAGTCSATDQHQAGALGRWAVRI
jgi:hypothetical protein